MMGLFGSTPERTKRWRALQLRWDDLIASGRSVDEAYMIASCEARSAGEQREQERKLAEIRENGT